MGFLSKAFGKLQNASSKYGWLTGGQNNYAEGRVGDFLNNITGSNAMLDREYANNVALWNMQNEYNTPSAQIARMKAAGIDVNPMTYAVGNGNMSTTASNISAPSVGASGINPIASLMSVLSGIEGIKSQKLANDMTRKDLEFYGKHGYRPGTSDWATKLIGLIQAHWPKGKNGSFVNPIEGKGLGTSNSYFMDALDDVISGSFSDNMRYYRNLKTKKEKDLYKRRLMDLRGYKEEDFKGW